MKIDKLSNMKRGWFVGDFDPTVVRTNDCEAAVKIYQAGDFEPAHFHKIATETTVIISGTVRMFDREFGAGDIIVVEPFDVTDFTAVTDSTTICVKTPGASNDKYIA